MVLLCHMTINIISGAHVHHISLIFCPKELNRIDKKGLAVYLVVDVVLSTFNV